MSDSLIPGFVTVRTSSTRLPNKCLLPFGAGNVLEHVIRRALKYGIDPIICTSVDRSDDAIEAIAKSEGVKFFRGSLTNKLKRWSDCAERFGLDSFHTVDADDPFFDGEEMHESMRLLKDKNYDIVAPTDSSSNGGASVGYSLTTDIVKRGLVGLADDADTEMMWYYLEKLPERKSVVLEDTRNRPEKLRLTLDYQEDYWLLATVQRLTSSTAPRKEIDDLFRRNPDLYKINWFHNQDWKEAQLAKKI